MEFEAFWILKIEFFEISEKDPQFSTDFDKIRFGPLILAYVVLVKRT